MVEPAESAGRAHTRAIVAFALIGALIVVAALAIVIALRLTVYSAGGFVEGYLHSLANHDAAAALEFPGVQPTRAELNRMTAGAAPAGTSGTAHPHVSRELLRGDVLGTIDGVHVTHESTDAHGRHHITVAYRLAPVPDGSGTGKAATTGPGAQGAVRHTSTFTLQRDGAIAGILPRWRFSSTPLAIARVTVAHAHTFTLAGHTLDVRVAAGDATRLFGATGDYLVFAPSSMLLGHTDELTEAGAVRATATRPGGSTTASVVAQPTAAFTRRVQTQLDHYLDGCTKQQVLQPTGCPMGKRIDNRVLGSPTWTITHYPAVQITPGDDGWTMPATAGTARLTVRVQSLFDGSVSNEKDTVPFTVAIKSIAIQPDGSLAITVAG